MVDKMQIESISPLPMVEQIGQLYCGPNWDLFVHEHINLDADGVITEYVYVTYKSQSMLFSQEVN
jgi:hypothetical protein